MSLEVEMLCVEIECDVARRKGGLPIEFQFVLMYVSTYVKYVVLLKQTVCHMVAYIVGLTTHYRKS